MAKILAFGACPLPAESARRQYAAGLRTWHFVEPLVRQGHEVRLVAMRLPRCYPDDVPEVHRERRDRLEIFRVSEKVFADPIWLQARLDEFEPDALLGINTLPSARLAELDSDRPMWCDLNGWIMAEAQTKTAVYDDDSYLDHFWSMEAAVLSRADVISTVSESQAYATVGELALHGRLTSASFGYEFTRVIPNAFAEQSYESTEPGIVRGRLVDDDAFVVLWLGGYNTWTDVDVLFDGLTEAMRRLDSVQFVSTGGAIEGHDEITFERFRQRIADSEMADRFHFCGWVPTEHVPTFYAESDLGINIDSFNYETVFGARNRINEMIRAGLPVLTTIGTEVSQVVVDRGLSLGFDIGDAQAFAERIVWAAEHRCEISEMARLASEFVLEEYSYDRTTEPLLAWLEAPGRAPDLGRRWVFGRRDQAPVSEPAVEEPEESPDRDHVEAAQVVDAGEVAGLQKELFRVRHELGEIHTSKMWKLWMLWQRVRGLFARR